jgi:3'-5' exoribonuclease
MDACILSMVDRFSGQADLIARNAPRGAGFGAYHRHLGGRPYVVRE